MTKNESPIRKSALLYPDQLAIHDAVVAYYQEMTVKPYTSEEEFDLQMEKPEPQPWFKKLLIGYAGTGKTTTVAAIIETLKLDFNASVVLSAPTHKAVRVAKRKSGIQGVTFSTLQKVLGVKAKPNYNTGEMEFEPDYEQGTALSRNTLLIIDEVSMVNQNLYEYLVKSDVQFPILFVGDSVQIPPVSDGKKKSLSDAAVFLEAIRKRDHIDVLELKEVRRQAAGNPIIALATRIRELYKKEIFPSMYKAADNFANDKGISISTDGDSDLKLVTSWFTSEEFKHDSDYCRVIAYRNATVSGYNKGIREAIFGEEATFPFVVGERLVFDEPYGRDDRFGRRNIIFQNSDEVKVSAVMPNSIQLRKPIVGPKSVTYQTITIPGLKLTLEYENDEGEIEIDFAIVPYSREAAEAVITEMEQTAKACYDKNLRRDIWKAVFRAKETIGWVNYAYAITAHKSQGSTYQKAFVAHWDIVNNFRVEERNRIMYVAVTRAAEHLHISC
jgi:hypothetical protein